MPETTKKNIYQKVQEVRYELQELKLKKTGENKFSKYFYYELGDFLPALNKLMHREGLITVFNISNKAYLKIINTDNSEESLTFYCESVKSDVKGANPIQNLGSQITYLRRYLLMTAFEIAESDAVDSQPNEPAPEALDQDLADRINSAQTQQELIDICGEIKKEFPDNPQNKKAEFIKKVMVVYTARKNELEKENANDNS